MTAWIRCDERMPEDADVQALFVAVDADGIRLVEKGYFYSGWRRSDDYFSYPENEILWWMPLPEPPAPDAAKGGT